MYYRTIVFDIDGVLCDSSQRQDQLPKDRTDSEQWKKFFNGCENDSVLPLAGLARLYHKLDYFIVLLTTRPPYTENKTIDWLWKNKIYFDRLAMKGKDKPAGYIWKPSMIEELEKENFSVQLIFEDDPMIIREYKKRGMPVVPIFSGYYDYSLKENSNVLEAHR